jgi:hypothetical protein
VDPDGQ